MKVIGKNNCNCSIGELMKNDFLFPDDYSCWAKDKNGEWHNGYIVVEQPWYSSAYTWTCWLYFNDYCGGGICGGAVDLGLDRIEIDPTIILSNSLNNRIKIYVELGYCVNMLWSSFFVTL